MSTASKTMIQDFKDLKKAGITDYICTTWARGRQYKPVLRHTAQGVSAYANQMYRKYGDEVAVEVGYFDSNFTWHTYCTYSA